jgi:uncharacterized OB-fold protein
MARNKLAGQPRPDSVKRKISKTQQERYRRARAQGLPDKKRCPKCNRVLPSPKMFGWTKRKLVSGEIVYHPRSWCKDCLAEKATAYRENLRKEGKLAAKQKEWNETRKAKKAAADVKRAKERQHMDTRNAGKRRRRANGAGRSA